MTQQVAASFDEFKNHMNIFSIFLSSLKKRDFKIEDVNSKLNLLLDSVEIQLDYYKEMDYKVRFFEWVQRKLAEEVPKNRDLHSDQSNRLLDIIRSGLKNRFEHILVAYPFVTEDVAFIKWKFRDILMVLYSFKEFGAFKDEYGDTEISHLKDLIFRSGYNFYGRIDVENSFEDTKTAWNRIMGRLTRQVQNRDDTISASENHAYQTLKKFSKDLQNAIDQYDTAH
jgi:hypothetical protein